MAPRAFADERVDSLTRAWDSALTFTVPDPQHITWLVESHKVALPGEIERLRADVAGKPDHPSRVRLHDLEKYVSRGPVKMLHQWWSRGPTSWRHSFEDQTFTSESGRLAYLDTIRSELVNWKMSESALFLMEPGAEAPIEHNVETAGRMARRMIGQMLTGGFSFSRSNLQLERGEFRFAGDTWTMNATFETMGMVVEYTGVWDSQHNCGQTTRAKVTSCSKMPDAVGTRWEFADWRHEPSLNRCVAYRCSNYLSDGRLEEVLHFVEVEAVTESEVRALLTPPTLDGIDPVRGKVTFRSLQDFHGSGTIVQADDAGKFVQHDGTNVRPPPNSRWLSIAGWTAAVSIVCLLLFIRFRRGAA